MSTPETHTLEVPGAVLCYDVRTSEPAGGPVLVMIGSPMGAAGFGTLATHFTDRTIVTYDPRGVERSERAEPAAAVTPDVHAADVRAVIEAVGGRSGCSPPAAVRSTPSHSSPPSPGS